MYSRWPPPNSNQQPVTTIASPKRLGKLYSVCERSVPADEFTDNARAEVSRLISTALQAERETQLPVSRRHSRLSKRPSRYNRIESVGICTWHARQHDRAAETSAYMYNAYRSNKDLGWNDRGKSAASVPSYVRFPETT